MANASSLSVTILAANSLATKPAADVLDTGTVPVTLIAAGSRIGGETDRVFLEVVNNGTAVATVSVGPGTALPAFRRGVGAVAGTVAGGTVTMFLGPFESARVCRSDGGLAVTFSPTGTIALAVTVLKLPKA